MTMPSLRRHVFAQLALFACTAHAGIQPIDPPYCATRVTGFVADITGVAQQAVAITGDCVGAGKSDVDCALDILSMTSLLTDSAEMMSDMAWACAGESSMCATIAIDSCEYFISIASRLLAAANACDEDVFLCVIFVIDAADNIVNFANDVQVSVGQCAPPSPPGGNRLLVKQSSDSQISPFYLALIGRSTKVDVNNTGGGANFVLQGRQGGSGGTTIAVDHPGIVRVGSGFVAPNAPAFVFHEGSAMTSYHNRRLEGKQERNDEASTGSEDVLHYYIDEDSALQEDHGFTLAGLE